MVEVESDNPVEFKDFASVRLFICWLIVITYTVLVLENVSYIWRLSTLILLLLSVLYLLVQIFDKRDQLKTTIWLSFATICSCLLLILHTLELMDNVMLAGFITGIVIVLSISWCFIGHIKQVTDAGWHWYVWSLTVMIIVCIMTITLNAHEETAIWIFSSNIVLVVLLHIRYIYELYISNARNLRCVRNILWVVCSGIVSILLLVGLLTFALENTTLWLKYVLGIEIFIAFAFLVDIGLICCCLKPHTYDRLQQQNDEP